MTTKRKQDRTADPRQAKRPELDDNVFPLEKDLTRAEAVTAGKESRTDWVPPETIQCLSGPHSVERVIGEIDAEIRQAQAALNEIGGHYARRSDYEVNNAYETMIGNYYSMRAAAAGGNPADIALMFYVVGRDIGRFWRELHAAKTRHAYRISAGNLGKHPAAYTPEEIEHWAKLAYEELKARIASGHALSGRDSAQSYAFRRAFEAYRKADWGLKYPSFRRQAARWLDEYIEKNHLPDPRNGE